MSSHSILPDMYAKSALVCITVIRLVKFLASLLLFWPFTSLFETVLNSKGHRYSSLLIFSSAEKTPHFLLLFIFSLLTIYWSLYEGFSLPSHGRVVFLEGRVESHQNCFKLACLPGHPKNTNKLVRHLFPSQTPLWSVLRVCGLSMCLSALLISRLSVNLPNTDSVCRPMTPQISWLWLLVTWLSLERFPVRIRVWTY